MEIELLEKVKRGQLTSTDEFQVPAIRRGTNDSEKYNTYCSLLDMISNGYIEGVKSTDGFLGPNYCRLQVTKSGLEVYKFWRTPISQIGKPTLWEVFRNGVLSAFAGRLVWWLVASIVLILIPTFSETARECLRLSLKWLLSLLS